MKDGLFWSGLFLQVVGLVVTSMGLGRTWREFAPEPFLRPVVQRAQSTWARAVIRLRRFFKRPPSFTVEAALELNEAGDALLATGRVGFGTIPDDRPVADAITELDQRTRRLLDQIADARQHHDGEFKTFRSDLGSLQGEVRRVEAELAESDRRVAVSGLRLEASGLLLVAGGVLLQGLGSLSG